MKRHMSGVMLLLFGINGCLGSGWLFAPLLSAQIAGPASILAWFIGSIMTILIAMTFVEAATVFPLAGISARLPTITHGQLTGFLMSWIGWLSSVTIPPIEVQTTIQYSSTYFPFLIQNLDGITQLSHSGLVVAGILLLILSVINGAHFRSLLSFNFIFLFVKTVIIALVILMLIKMHFDPRNFTDATANKSWSDWHAIFSAVASGGILFALGFKHTVELVGEVENPGASIALGILGSVVCCGLLYIALQIAFIGALDRKFIANGWEHLAFSYDAAPLLGLMMVLGVKWLVQLLYIDSLVSPLGCGLVYVASSARIIYAMSRSQLLSEDFSKLNEQSLPVSAVILNFVVGMSLFLPLPGWQAMANFFVSTVALSYAFGPIAVLALREQYPEKPRDFRLPAVKVIAAIAFVCCNLMIYWTGWETVSKLIIAASTGIIVYLIVYWRKLQIRNNSNFCALWWLIPHLIMLTIISYFGNFGGINKIKFGYDIIVISLVSCAALYAAVKTRSTQMPIDNI